MDQGKEIERERGMEGGRGRGRGGKGERERGGGRKSSDESYHSERWKSDTKGKAETYST